MPSRGAVLIVRNEAQTIERCLASARAAGVEVVTLVDTGSDDETVEIAEMYGAVVHRRPWVNFGHNRSEAFALARGTADWLLALDADMTVEWDEGWEPDPDVDAYMLEMGSGDFSYRLPLLLRGDLPWKSVGSVHEFTVLEDGTLGRREPTDHVRITHHGEGRSSPEKSRWHASLLEADFDRDPSNARTIFYLAQAYRELGDERAREFYAARSRMGGWDEEQAVAARWAALLEPEWPERCAGLIAAWEMRPSRLEPLCDLLRELNSRGHHHAAYLLSTSGLVAASRDVLFVDRSVEWQVPFERSIAAWHLGHHDEFRRLTGQLLLTPTLPEHIRAQVMVNFALPVAA